jgi:hypothetical protein
VVAWSALTALLLELRALCAGACQPATLDPYASPLAPRVLTGVPA